MRKKERGKKKRTKVNKLFTITVWHSHTFHYKNTTNNTFKVFNRVRKGVKLQIKNKLGYIWKGLKANNINGVI